MRWFGTACACLALAAAPLCAACGEGVHGWQAAQTVSADVGPEGGRVSLSWATLTLDPNAVAEPARITLRTASPSRRGSVGPAVEVVITGGALKLEPQLALELSQISAPHADRTAIAWLEPAKASGEPAPQWVPFETTRSGTPEQLVARVNGFTAESPSLTFAPVLKCVGGGDQPLCPQELPECRAGVCQ